MFTIKTKSKMLKAQWKEFSLREFMSRRRYVCSDPKKQGLRNFILTNFLFVVIGFVGWNISLSVPEISMKWDRGPIILENPAMASNMKPSEVVEEKEIEITDCYSASKVMSKKYSVPEELMNKIIKAESGNNPLVENKVSTATGCSQWILGSWRSYGKMLWGEDFHSKNIYSPKDNVELLAWTIANYGTSPWDASRAVWGK